MSKRLFLATAAAAPFCALFLGQAAEAQTTISGGTSTPLTTSASGDITINDGAGITLTNVGPAITLNSNNNVTNSGTITITDVDNSTGVLILGGNTGSFTQTASGVINVNTSYTASDTINNDGVVEAPFATGAGRFGVRITGTTPFVGNINALGSINVSGNTSYAFSVEAPVNGSITLSGVSLTGDNGVAVNLAAPISGQVTLSGGVVVQGMNSVGVSVTAPIAGSLAITSSVTNTGYSLTTRPTVGPALTNIENTPTDVEQGGPAVSIASNVAGGVYTSAPPAGTVAGSTADLDMDGIPDGAETSSSIVQSGSAPALQIGAANGSIALGPFGTGLNAYGLLVRGAISAQGVYDNVPATAVQIGLPGGTVNIAGGARITGTLTSTSYNANSYALHIGAGSTVPEVRIEGNVTGTVAASTDAVNAYAVLIDQGANVSTINNFGTISAAATGDNASSGAIVDKSGTVTTVNNYGAITPTIGATVAGDTLTGTAIALDLRANTTGVTLIQQLNPNPNVVFGSTSGTADTSTTVNTAVSPSIAGDVLLGSGPNTVYLFAGTMTGALNMGQGNAKLSIDGGAVFTGPLAHGSGSFDIVVNNGTLGNTSAAALPLTSLTLGPGGVLGVAVDPANNAASFYNVSGPVTVASGAQLSITLNSILRQPQTFTVISTPSLTGQGATGLTVADVPYLFVPTVSTNESAGTVSLALRQKTPIELGFNRSETAAFSAIYNSLPNDTEVQTAVLQQTTQSGLVGIYDQLLPDHSGGSFLAAQAASEAIGRAPAEPDVAEAGGLWATEIAYGMDENKGETSAYRASGFGLVGGLEADSNLGAFGLTAAFVTGDTADPTLPGNNYFTVTQVEAGAYWRAQHKGFIFDASGSAGYVSLKSNRELVVGAADNTPSLDRNAAASWNGYSLSGRAGLAYELKTGRFYIRPQAHVDYFLLHENAYHEDGGGTGYDLSYAARQGDALTATASIVAGMTFGTDVKWRPEIEIGYRDTLSGTAGNTTAMFQGGSAFTLTPNPITGPGEIARIALVAEADYLKLVLEAGALLQGKQRSGDVRATVRMRF